MSEENEETAKRAEKTSKKELKTTKSKEVKAAKKAVKNPKKPVKGTKLKSEELIDKPVVEELVSEANSAFEEVTLESTHNVESVSDNKEEFDWDKAV